MHNETKSVNSYIAILLITVVGATAVFLITHVAGAVADDADSISALYESGY